MNTLLGLLFELDIFFRTAGAILERGSDYLSVWVCSWPKTAAMSQTREGNLHMRMYVLANI